MGEGTFDVDIPGGSVSNGQPEAGDGGDHLKRFLDDTLASVLRSAQESAAELMERTRQASDQEAALARQLRELAQKEMERMVAWRSHVEPLVHAVNDKADAIRLCVADVPGRVAEALAPVNEALSDVDHVLARLTEVLRERNDGPGDGPGPGGGSRAFGTLGEAVTGAGPMPAEVMEAPPAGQAGSVPVAVPAAPYEAEGAAAAAEAADADGTAGSRRWVDWPGDQDQPQEDVANTEPEAERAEDPDGSHDEDDAALRSATTQLRRAVTDIDWRDLPSASNG